MNIIIEALQLGTKPTGIQVFTFNILKQLSIIDKINKYTIYSLALEKEVLDLSNNNISICNISSSPLSWHFWRFWYRTGFSAQLRIQKPDLFLATHHVIPLFCPSPVITIIHDTIPLIIEGAVGGLLGKSYFNVNAKYAAKHADAIITISQSSKRDIINYFKVKSEKVYVVNPGYNDVFFNAQKNGEEIKVVKQKLSINGNYILYVGTLQTNKNIPRLIQAFTLLKERGQITHKLVLAGKSSAGYGEITKAVESSSANKDIVLTGYVPKELLPSLLKGADAFVFPSLHEGFGIPPMEAMACGTPVITSNTSSLPEVVGDAGILVNPYDVAGLADAMYSVISDEKLRLDLRQKSLKRVEMFSWERAGREFLRIFELVGRKRSNRELR